MIDINRFRSAWIGMIVLLALPISAPAQRAGKQPEHSEDAVKALIDLLTEVNKEDVRCLGVHPSPFLPFENDESYRYAFFEKRRVSSKALRSLVALGARALPALLAHLNDARPTKAVLTGGAIWVGPDVEDEDSLDGTKLVRQYTVTVGDLCYVAIGEIVNRPYYAVQYVNATCVTSPCQSKKLRERLIKEWANLTTDRHRDSLARDIDQLINMDLRNGASLRLAYYYPDAFEPIAIQQTKRGNCLFGVDKFIRSLYDLDTAKQRKALLDEFVQNGGPVAVDAIRCRLFEDLRTQERDEESHVSRNIRARQCLIDLFGLPAAVKSKDAPTKKPLPQIEQVEFMQTLRYDGGEKLDREVRDLLAKIDDDRAAKSCLDRLVGRGYDADIEAYLKRRFPSPSDYDPCELQRYQAKLGWTRLHAAVELDIVELLERALRDKPAIDAQGRDGATALHLAAASGNQENVKLLLAAKANPNIKDVQGRLPAAIAGFRDHAPVVRLLVASKSEVPDVHVAAIVGATDRLEALLKDNPDALEELNSRVLTALHVAAREGQAGAVEKLLARGAQVDSSDESVGTPLNRELWTPLHLAAMWGRSEVAKVLLDHGAKVNAADNDARTPLHYAAGAGNGELVKMLLAQKANRSAKDKEDRTPLDLAKEKKHLSVIKLLEK
jgi:ankyrin repeat protein